MMNAVRSAAGRPARALRTAPVLGPAFVAAIAYVDPGNFATNFAAGSEFGYLLLWVIVAANVMAMLIQSLSAKLGLATGRNLPEVCRDTFPRRVSIGLWVQAECVAIATDLAEVIGGAVALYLLFGLPLPIGGLVTGVVAFGLLALQERGHRPFERAVAGLLRRDRRRVRDHGAAGPDRARAAGRRPGARASPAPRACCWPRASSARR